MRVGAADVPVRWLVRSQCVYVTVGTTRTAMKEIALMTTLPLYSTHEKYDYAQEASYGPGMFSSSLLLGPQD